MEKQTDTFYYTVYRDIITQIYMGKYKKGDNIPSLKELCDIYGVGRNTARSALLLLQEHGFINIEPRKQAVVSFDIENSRYQKYYFTELLEREKSILEVYDFIEIVLPEIFIYILKRMTRSLRREIAGLVGYFAENLSLKTEIELQAGTSQLYNLVIALPNNQLLEQLYFSLFSYVQIPLSNREWNKVAYKAMSSLFRTTFKRFQKQLSAQEFDKLQQQISFFCKTMKNNTNRYLKKLNKKVKVEAERGIPDFSWSITGKPAYVQLASELVNKIGRGEYQEGSILPSYMQLAAENGVSELTSRKAIEILAKLELVSTINGVGSKVMGFSLAGRNKFLEDGNMRGLLISYFEAMQVMLILGRPILHSAEERMTEKECADLEQRLMGDGLTYSIEALLPYAGTVATAVFECLKSELVWGYLLNFDMEEQRGELPSKQLAKQGASMAEQMYTDYQEYFRYAEEIARKCSVDIPLIKSSYIDTIDT